MTAERTFGDGPTPGGSSPQPRLVTSTFVLVTAATLAYFTSIGILIPVLPLFVKRGLGAGDVAVGLAVGAFSVSALFLRPWAGRLGDARGRRVLLLAGGLLAGSSALGLLVAESLPLLVALRLLAGVGEACFFVGAATVINDLAPDERRGEAMSLFSVALYGALAIGPVAGELLLDGDRFAAVWVASAGCALSAALLSLRVPETRAVVGAPDPGRRARLLHPAAIGPGLVITMGIWGFAGFDAFAALYARELGLSGSRGAFALFAGTVLVVRVAGARLPDRLGFVRCARIAFAGMAAGLATIGLWEAPAGLYAGTFVFALGQGLAFPSLMSAAVDGAPVEERGAVIGSFTAFVDLAFGVGALTLGAVADRAGYAGSFLFASGVAIVGLLLLTRMRPGGRDGPERRPPPTAARGTAPPAVEDPSG